MVLEISSKRPQVDLGLGTQQNSMHGAS